MKPFIVRIGIALTVVLTVGPAAYAHHGWSEYDSNKG